MLSELDDSQRAFCTATSRNIRLLAPAGCGKTRSLLFRCAYLSSQSKNHKPKFLIVTFTLAAKQELLSRLNEDSLFSGLRDNIEISTLNSWGFRRIKSAAAYPKLITKNDDFYFTVKNALQPIWSQHDKVKKSIEAKPNQRPKKIMGLIDLFKSVGFDHTRHKSLLELQQRLIELFNQGLYLRLAEIESELRKLDILSPDQVGEIESLLGQPSNSDEGNGNASATQRIASEIYESFYCFWREAVDHLINQATFTLEDQKYFAYLDEQKKLDDGKYLSGAVKYDHVLVDEFQDVNPLDLALVCAIVERNRSTLTIVGDDDQAIFEWRGATPEYILNPDKYFHREFETFTLETNYRSPRNIVDHSQKLIVYNQRRVPKSVRSIKAEEAAIDIIESEDLSETMDIAFREIEISVLNQASPSRIAIIGRKRSQIIPYQVYFASKNVSFCAAEDLQVFMSDAFDRLLELFRIRAQSGVKNSRRQAIDHLLKLMDLVKRYPLKKTDKESIRRAMNPQQINTLMEATEALELYTGSLKGQNPNGSTSLNMAQSIRSFISAKTVSDALYVLSAEFEGLQTDMGKAEDDVFFTDPPFRHLAEYAARYTDDDSAFVDDLELAKDQLAYLPPVEHDDAMNGTDELWKRPVHLMTALRAKGKEFDTVILLDVNDGIWPNKNALTPEQKEAERRVFYVAFTRAKSRLVITTRLKDSRGLMPVSPYLQEARLVDDVGSDE